MACEEIQEVAGRKPVLRHLPKWKKTQQTKPTNLTKPKQTNKQAKKTKYFNWDLCTWGQQCQSASLLQTRTSPHWLKGLRCKTSFPVTKSSKARSTHSCDPNVFLREGAVLQGELCTHHFGAAADEGNILRMTVASECPCSSSNRHRCHRAQWNHIPGYISGCIYSVGFPAALWVLHSKLLPDTTVFSHLHIVLNLLKLMHYFHSYLAQKTYPSSKEEPSTEKNSMV